MLTTARGLARSCHPGPTMAVTVLAALLSVALNAPLQVGALLVLAVLSGQLLIGWSNDLIDADRDHADGRADKPLAGGEVVRSAVWVAMVGAGVLCVVASLSLGWVPGTIHLLLLVGSGLAYNLGVKATLASFLPYALAFGSLPAVVWLAVGESEAAGTTAGGPPGWMVLAGACLGVGAHLLNVLPDLADDARHGIRGLPHRLGLRRTQLLAPTLLGCGTLLVVIAPAGSIRWWDWGVITLAAALAVVAARGRGKTPFNAAIALALLSAGALVAHSWAS